MRFDWLGIGRRPRLRTLEEFHSFLSREAAHLAQTTATNYSRARAGWQAEKLFRESMFLDALDRCRWEAYAAVLADMIVIAEGRLRAPSGAPDLPMIDSLVSLYRRILETHPRPAHRPEGWQDLVAALGPRLAKAQLAAPADPDKVARSAGRRLYDVLPFDRSIIAGDRDVVVNSVRFAMVRFSDRMNERLDLAAIREALLREAAV